MIRCNCNESAPKALFEWNYKTFVAQRFVYELRFETLDYSDNSIATRIIVLKINIGSDGITNMNIATYATACTDADKRISCAYEHTYVIVINVPKTKHSAMKLHPL